MIKFTDYYHINRYVYMYKKSITKYKHKTKRKHFIF